MPAVTDNFIVRSRQGLELRAPSAREPQAQALSGPPLEQAHLLAACWQARLRRLREFSVSRQL